MQKNNVEHEVQGYHFVRCNVSVMEWRKWHHVKGKVGEIACGRDKSSWSGADEIALGEMDVGKMSWHESLWCNCWRLYLDKSKEMNSARTEAQIARRRHGLSLSESRDTVRVRSVCSSSSLWNSWF
jgi:hypothetical protein